MNNLNYGFKQFYDGNSLNMREVFRIIKERPYLMYFFEKFHCEDDWTEFKNAQMAAFKAGYEYALNTAKKIVVNNTAPKETPFTATNEKDVFEYVSTSSGVETKTTETSPVIVAEDLQPKEKKPFNKSDYVSSRIVAEETASDPAELRKWCIENHIQVYGRGFLLNKKDFDAWCQYINYPNGIFPIFKCVKSE